MARTRIHGQQVTDGSIELVDLSSALASTITGKADAGNLAPVATSGSYNDLTNLPTLFSGAYADLTGKPSLFSGAYADLSGKPTLFDGAYSSLSGAPTLATVATSGSYNDLSNLPTLFSGAYADLTGKPTLFSGSYNDLTDKPTFSSDLDGLTDVAITSPSADQVLKYNGTSWVNATAPATFSGSYTDLTDKPTLASFTTLTSPASGQYLKFNGSAWVNSAIAAADLPVAQNSAGILDTGFQIILGEKRFSSTIQASSMTSSGTSLTLSAGLGGTFPGGKIVFTGGSTTGSMDFYTKVNGQQFQEQIRANISDLGLFSMYYGASIQSGAAATKGLIVKGAASQSANLFEAQNSSGTALLQIDSAGQFALPSAASPFVIKGHADSAWNTHLFRVGNSTLSSSYMNVNGDGRAAFGLGTNLNGNNTYYGGNINAQVSITAGSSMPLIIRQGSVGDAPLYPIFSVEANTVVPVMIASRYGTTLRHSGDNATYTPLTIIGNHVSQTGDLLKLKNNSNTDVFAISASGSITVGTVPVARVTGLHAVATSGSYNDLSDKPSIPSIAGLATEIYVDTAVAAVVNSAPAVLDTLNELAAALNDDPNFATTMTTALAAKADSSSLAAVATSGSYVDLSNKPTIYAPVKEVFTSLVDGTETEFVLADAPAVAGTEQVFVNGILQSSGAGDDYTISGDTITFNTAPEAGWKLIVYYFV